MNPFEYMTVDQAVGAVALASTAILGIAGMIWAAIESERP